MSSLWVSVRGVPADLTSAPGVRNLRHIATTMAQQKLAYEFPYSSFELETDLTFILLSEGKAILPVGRLTPIAELGAELILSVVHARRPTASSTSSPVPPLAPPPLRHQPNSTPSAPSSQSRGAPSLPSRPRCLRCGRITVSPPSHGHH